jgi:DNA-directed RNA polymerase specialized sigma24 family protein
LDRVRRQLTTEDWSLLQHIADGYTYRELSVVEATTPGSLRVRVYRLRRALRPVVEEVLDQLVAG